MKSDFEPIPWRQEIHNPTASFFHIGRCHSWWEQTTGSVLGLKRAELHLLNGWWCPCIWTNTCWKMLIIESQGQSNEQHWSCLPCMINDTKGLKTGLVCVCEIKKEWILFLKAQVCCRCTATGWKCALRWYKCSHGIVCFPAAKGLKIKITLH